MQRPSRVVSSSSRRVTDLKDALWSGSLTFQNALSTFAADESTSGRKFASYTMFKGNAALLCIPYCLASANWNHEGQVKKSLSITHLGNDSGYFLNITVLNNLQKTTERLSLPITKAEFAVMRTALSFALPHILCWDQALTNHQPSPSASKPRVERPHPDSEWER